MNKVKFNGQLYDIVAETEDLGTFIPNSNSVTGLTMIADGGAKTYTLKDADNNYIEISSNEDFEIIPVPPQPSASAIERIISQHQADFSKLPLFGGIA